MVLDWVSSQALGDNDVGIQLTLLRKLEDLDFAGDIVLLSQKITHVEQKFEALQEQATRDLETNKEDHCPTPDFHQS